MKWGVRRYQNPDGTLTSAGKARYDKAQKRIDRIEKTRQENREYVSKQNQKREDKYSRKASKLEAKRQKAQLRQDIEFDESEITNKYLIAKQKAKQDSSYKKSKEYSDLKKAYTEQYWDEYVLGNSGRMRIQELERTKNYSHSKAAGRVFLEQWGKASAVGVITTVGIAGAMVGSALYYDRK